MAIQWNDLPQWSRGHLYIHRPELLKTMTVNEPGGITYPVENIDFDGESGVTAWDKKNTFCTVTFNDGSQTWDPTVGLSAFMTHGICPVFYIYETLNILTLPQVSRGVGPYHINPLDNYQIYVWEDYRPWALPVTFISVGGNPRHARKKGNIAAGNSMREIALNIGSAGVFDQVGANGYVDLDFSADPVSPRNDTPLGTTVTFGVNATLTASSTNGGNVVANAYDGSSSTYWESASGSSEWLKVDLGVSNTDALTAFGIWIYTAGTFPVQILVEGSDNDTDYTPVAYKIPTTDPISNAAIGYYTVDCDRNIPVYRYYRFSFDAPQSGASFTAREFKAYTYDPDDLPNDPDWDAGAASLVTGSSSTADITVRYPPGFYYIKAGTWSETGYWRLARRPVCILDSERKYATNYGATASASNYVSTYTPASAFDKDLTEYQGWGTLGAIQSLDIEYPSERCFAGFRMMAGWDDALRPEDVQIQYKNELAGTYHNAFTSSDLTITADDEWFEFTFDAPVWAKTWRLQVNSVNSGTNIFVRELEYIHHYPYGFAQRKVDLQSHAMTPAGQTMTFRVWDDVSDYPPGTLVMFKDDEYYQGVKGSLAAADPTGKGRGPLFVGWIDEQRTHVERNADGTVAYTDLVCYDIGGWANKSLYVPPVMKNYADPLTTTPIDGYRELGLLSGLNIDYAVFMILMEFTTFLELADFYPAETWFQYRVPIIELATGSVYGIADSLARNIAHRLTINKMGQFKLLPDGNLQQAADRTATTQQSIGPGDIRAWDYARKYSSQVGQLRGGAIVSNAKGYDNVAGGMTALFATAPDVDALGQGPSVAEHGAGVVIDQTELNIRIGQLYAARHNPEFAPIRLELAYGNDAGIDPARMEPILLTITSAAAGPNGWTCTNQRCYPLSMTIEHDAVALTKRVVLTVELEVDGVPAETYTPPS